MDTKSRKSTKLAKIIITLCVLLPALLLVSLYPRMETAMMERRDFYKEQERQHREEIGDWILADNVVNYAVESSYYIYAKMQELPLLILDAYGWNNDYERFKEGASYIASYIGEDGIESIEANRDRIEHGLVNITIEYDSFGNMTVVDFKCEDNVYVYEDELNARKCAMDSVAQFENNLSYYNEYENVDGPILSKESYAPKNFKLEVALYKNSFFIGTYEDWYGYDYYHSPENLCYEVGAYWIVAILILFVIFAAMTLPCFKKLNTGNERLFSMSFEVMLVLALVTIAGVYAMCYAMSRTTMTTMREIVGSGGYTIFMGYPIASDYIYLLALAASFLGWGLIFFFVYALSANIRQLFCDTKSYLKYQTLSVKVFHWIKNKIVKIYNRITKIDLRNNLDKSIIKIVILNFIVLFVLGCLKIIGLFGLVIYTIALFVLIRRKMKKMQNQYENILSVTEQMAKGDLKISLEEDLGILQPIGDSLEKIQQGFDKAVKEEAKSQNMKTELITNVSHDLKTPLTAIITYVDLLKKEGVTEEERKSYIQTLDQKSQRLKVLIEDLFEISKANSGNVTMNYMDVDVASLLKQVKSEMDDQIKTSNLEFKWNIPDERVILSLDGQRTYRVFENLISNALKYSLPNSRVYITLTHDEEVKIVFRNVSAQELDFDPERLTDRFVRGDSSRNSEGSGLGLAIAKSFVELQKGSFKIDVDGDIFKVIISWKK